LYRKFIRLTSMFKLFGPKWWVGGGSKIINDLYLFMDQERFCPLLTPTPLLSKLFCKHHILMTMWWLFNPQSFRIWFFQNWILQKKIKIIHNNVFDFFHFITYLKSTLVYTLEIYWRYLGRWKDRHCLRKKHISGIESSFRLIYKTP
jgi:hypothetical protein